MIAELQTLGWEVDVLDIGSGFPQPAPNVRAQARARLASVPAGDTIVIDGLALGVLPEVATVLGSSHKLIALVHHPLALETGLSEAQAAALRASEQAALAHVRHVVVTSPSTARILKQGYGVPAECITVAVPGSERAAPAQRKVSKTIALLSVGSLVPRKGYDVLLAALASLTDLPWRLTIVGDPTRSPATAASIEEAIVRLKLADRVMLAGAVAGDRLPEFYRAADIFVLASRFEGYGMAFADAVAHGLPVIGTTAGAIAESVPKEAAILVEPDDATALASALRQLIGDTKARANLAKASRAAARKLPTWQASAKIFASVLETMR
jgi:glycosyltransferase involved in cell wall biosynthesis